jgi:hypothetical protein
LTAPFSTSALATLLDYVRTSPEGWRGLDRVVASRQWHFPLSEDELEIKTIPPDETSAMRISNPFAIGTKGRYTC